MLFIIMVCLTVGLAQSQGRSFSASKPQLKVNPTIKRAMMLRNDITN
jgi:hypothetical protein